MANLPDEVYTGIRLAVESLEMKTGAWASLKKVFINGQTYGVRVKAKIVVSGDPKQIDIQIKRRNL